MLERYIVHTEPPPQARRRRSPRAGIAQVAVDGRAPAKRTADRHRGSRPCAPVRTPAAGARAAPVGVPRAVVAPTLWCMPMSSAPAAPLVVGVRVRRPLRVQGRCAERDAQAEGRCPASSGSSGALAVLTAIIGARPRARPVAVRCGWCPARERDHQTATSTR